MTRWPFSGWVVVVLDEVAEEEPSELVLGAVEVVTSTAMASVVDLGPGSAMANPQTAKAAAPATTPPMRMTSSRNVRVKEAEG
jgi:hypothetical protein